MVSIRQQAIIWTDVYQVVCRRMESLETAELFKLVGDVMPHKSCEEMAMISKNL